MHVHVDPGGSAATERNGSFALESADAGVDGEVLETRRDVQDVGKSVETFPTTSIEETLPGRAPERPVEPSDESDVPGSLHGIQEHHRSDGNGGDIETNALCRDRWPGGPGGDREAMGRQFEPHNRLGTRWI